MVHKELTQQNTYHSKSQFNIVKLSEIIGEEKLKEITTMNAQKVLENKRIDIDEPKQIKLSLKEKIILKCKMKSRREIVVI